MKKLIVIITSLLLVITGCSQEASSGEITATDDLGREVTFSTETIYADSYQGQLMYLGANLVGTDLTYQSESWPQDKVSALTDTGGDMELVASLHPTLIITFYEDLVDQYSTIAPTYYIEYGKEDPVEIMTRLGDLLQMEDKAAGIEDAFNSRIDEIKAEIDQPDLTYTIVESEADAIYLMGDNWARGGFILYDYLGMKGSELGEETYIHTDPTYITIDEEGLLSYESDGIIIISTDPENSLVMTSDIYDQLPAVQNGNVGMMDTNYAWYDDPYAVEGQLDFFEEMFAGDL